MLISVPLPSLLCPALPRTSAVFCADHNKDRAFPESFPGLNGTIPTSVSDLESLRELHLHVNSFGGVIPDELSECTELSEYI